MINTTDITMCTNDFCERASDCYRFLALQSPWQRYLNFKIVCKAPEFMYFTPMINEKIKEIGKDDES